MTTISYDNLLIDGKNCVYRGIYAGLSDEKFKQRNRHFAVIFFRFLVNYIRKFNPNSIHVFWDAPKSTLWRKELFPDYKENRRSKVENIDELVNDVILISKKLLPILGVRMYELPHQEADDLIYSYCKSYLKQSHIIISSDGDFKQMVYQFKNVAIFDPLNDKFIDNIDVDPVDEKCFQGERGDNITGYEKIGKVNAGKICESQQKKMNFLKTRGIDIYVRNRKLIDLALCPFMCENMLYIIEQSIRPVIYDRKLFIQTIYESKIKGMGGEINNILLTFKQPSI